MTTQSEPTPEDEEPSTLEKTGELLHRIMQVPKSEVEKLRKKDDEATD